MKLHLEPQHLSVLTNITIGPLFHDHANDVEGPQNWLEYHPVFLVESSGFWSCDKPRLSMCQPFSDKT